MSSAPPPPSSKSSLVVSVCENYVKLKSMGKVVKDKLKESEEDVLNFLRTVPGQILKISNDTALCIKVKKPASKGWTNALLAEALMDLYGLSKSVAAEDVKKLAKIRTDLNSSNSGDADEQVGKEYVDIKQLSADDLNGGGGSKNSKKQQQKGGDEKKKSKKKKLPPTPVPAPAPAASASPFVPTTPPPASVAVPSTSKIDEDLR